MSDPERSSESTADPAELGDEPSVAADEVAPLAGGVEVVDTRLASLEGGVDVVPSETRPPSGSTTVEQTGGVEVVRTGSPQTVESSGGRRTARLAIALTMLVIALGVLVLVLGGCAHTVAGLAVRGVGSTTA